MQRKHKIPLAIAVGTLSIVGIALWMRELMAWRPATIIAWGTGRSEMSVSNDGRCLWIGDVGGEGQALTTDFSTPHPAIIPPEKRMFQVYKGIETFPCLVRRYDGTDFQLKRGSKVIKLPVRSSACAYSLERNEIYTASFISNAEAKGNFLSTWNMSDGHLKQRVPYGRGLEGWLNAFSPDGKWLIAAQSDEGQSERIWSAKVLHRYDVQTGQQMEPLNMVNAWGDIGRVEFSPNGQYLLAAPGLTSRRALVFETSTWKRLWSVGNINSADWLPDNRLGISTVQGLEWRDAATGRTTRTRYGPLKGTLYWTISPDERWIYAVDATGTMRRWRAS